MFPVRKKGPTINRVVAKTNQVICNSRSFKVSNIRPARKSAELVRRQHAWGAIACYPRRRRPNSAFSAIAVAADCSDRADSKRTLWGAGLGTSGAFHPKMSCLLFFALVLPFHLSEAYTVRPGRCPEYVMGESTYRTCQINPLKAMEFCVWPSTAIHFPFIFRHDQFWQDLILGWMVWIRQCVWVLPGLTL